VTVDPGFWIGRRVLLTGHTGFVGSWAALWLEKLGARVTGLALAPDSEPSLFRELAPWSRLNSVVADLRDPGAVAAVVNAAEPQVVIHMAAQALVRRAYREPALTWATNVMGTVHLCEALRDRPEVESVLVVTSDKTYLNAETGRPFIETDPLGGHDPYSASKASQEMVTMAWAHSYLHEKDAAVGTARAGNLIGGGDWAEDRLVPDLWRAARANETVWLRYPYATRPWLHVLDALAGYLQYAERLATGAEAPEALNFGPASDESLTVAELAGRVLVGLGAQDTWRADDRPAPTEKRALALDAETALQTLGWRPLLSADEAVHWTVQWYRAFDEGEDMRAFCERQIEEHGKLE